MTSEQLNVLRAQMAATIRAQRAGWTMNEVIDDVDSALALLGITADEPAPAGPAETEPDYRGLLCNLLIALKSEGVNTYYWNLESVDALTKANTAVLP